MRNAIDPESAALAAIKANLKRMLERVTDPCEVGWEIWEIAFTHAFDSPQLMRPLWLIWGALTDWVALKPLETVQAKQAMLRAGREWFALDPGDEKARDAYFDRWIHDELRIERKKPNPPPPSTGSGQAG